MIATCRINKGAAQFPEELDRFLGRNAPDHLEARGDAGLIHAGPSTGLFCSVRCPGNLILRTYDLARVLRDEGRLVISGFHSPMEKECLDLLLKGAQPVIAFVARGISTLRLPAEWGNAIDEGRLLVLSGFPDAGRATVDRAVKRNLCVAAMADEVFLAHAERGSKTEAFATTLASWGKPLLTLEDKFNEGLISLGAKPVHVTQRARSPRGIGASR